MDELRFKIVNPKGKEDWIEDFANPDKVVEIYLNNEELVDIARSVEIQYLDEDENYDDYTGYGHLIPKELYSNLTNNICIRHSEDCDYNGAELLCCAECGESGCWSVTVHIEMDDEKVYWSNLSNNHRDWDFNMEFCFDRKDYEEQLQWLKQFN